MCPFLSLFILLLILFTYYNLLKFFGLSFFPPQGLIGLLGISWDNFGLSFCISEFVCNKSQKFEKFNLDNFQLHKESSFLFI